MDIGHLEMKVLSTNLDVMVMEHRAKPLGEVLATPHIKFGAVVKWKDFVGTLVPSSYENIKQKGMMEVTDYGAGYGHTSGLCDMRNSLVLCHFLFCSVVIRWLSAKNL